MSKHRLTRISCATLALALATSLVVSACSSDNNGTGDGNGSGAGSSNGNKGGSSSSSSGAGGGSAAQPGAGSSNGGSSSTGTGGSSASSGAGTSGTVPTDACPGLPFADSGQAGAGAAEAGASGDMACTGVSEETEAVPVDIFILMDRSMSLGNMLPNSTMTRWDALKAAVEAFVQSSSAGAIGAGIGFFPYTDHGDLTLDCSVANYSTPAVGIAPLSTNGANLVKAIGDTPPGGLTPVVPALQGGLSYATSWATAHPGRATVVVLVSDGFPTECGGSPSDVASAIQGAYMAAPHIKTYVVGVGLATATDSARFNLDNYAQSGGTKKAFLADDMSNVTDTIVHALLNISDSTLACEYAIPKPTDASMQLDPNKVQIVYTPASGEALEVPKVPAVGGCASAPNGGWFYDNPSAPTKIQVCPCTCASFAAGRVDVRLGCSPRISIR